MTEHLAEFVGGPFHGQTRALADKGDAPNPTFYVVTSKDKFVAGETQIIVEQHTYERSITPEFVGPTSTLWKYFFNGTVDA